MNPNGNGESPKAPTAPIQNLTPRPGETSRGNNEAANTPQTPEEEAQAKAAAEKKAEEAQRAKKANKLAEDLEGGKENPSGTFEDLAGPPEPAPIEPAQPTSQADKPDSHSASETDQPSDVNIPVVPDGGSQDVGGDNDSTAPNESQEPPISPETVPDAAFTGPPPVEPEDTAEATASAPKSPEPAPTDTETGSESEPQPAPVPGNPEAQKPSTPDVQKTEDQVQQEIETRLKDFQKKLAEAPMDKNDPNYDAELARARENYEKRYRELVPDDIQKTINEMDGSGKNSLKDRIDEARKNEQMTLAHTLEERQARINEVTEQAKRQAAMEEAGKAEMQSRLQIDKIDAGKIEEARKESVGEADARRALRAEELKAEKGKMNDLDKFSEEIDKAKKNGKKAGTVKLLTEQLNVLKRERDAEAMENILKGTESGDMNTISRAKKMLELSKDGGLLSKNRLLTDDEVSKSSDQITALRQLAKREALLAAKEEGIIGKDAMRKRKGSLGELADRIDEASGSNTHLNDKDTVKFADAQKTFEEQFAKRIAEIRGEAAEILAVNDLSKLGNTDSQAVKNKLESTAEYQKKLATESDQDKEDNKDARKQLKQRLGAYARRWGQSFKEWRHAKPEDKAKARKELLLSTRAVAKEAGKRLLIILGIWTIIQFLLMFSGEMRIMGKMFGQDGKG